MNDARCPPWRKAGQNADVKDCLQNWHEIIKLISSPLHLRLLPTGMKVKICCIDMRHIWCRKIVSCSGQYWGLRILDEQVTTDFLNGVFEASSLASTANPSCEDKSEVIFYLYKDPQGSGQLEA